MINIYKLDNVDIISIDTQDLYNMSSNVFPFSYLRRYNITYFPFPPSYSAKFLDNIEENDSRGKAVEFTELFDSSKFLNEITYDDVLFFHNNCSIPRAKASQKFKRTIKKEKATVCVIPNKKDEKYSVVSIGVFYNKEHNIAFIARGQYSSGSCGYTYHSALSLLKPVNLGDTVLSINPLLSRFDVDIRQGYQYKSYSKDTYKWLLEAKLVYKGYAIEGTSQDTWIGDLMYNKLHDVVTEDIVLSMLGDTSNAMSMDLYNSIKDMLNSADREINKLALKTLAELDYSKYRNTIVHLLISNSSAWRYTDIKHNSTVKFMLKNLGLYYHVTENYSDVISPEDYALFDTTLISSTIKSQVESTIQYLTNKFPFLNLDIDYTYTVTPKFGNPSPEESKKGEEEDEESEDILDPVIED